MQMRHRFTAMRAVVDDHAETGVGHALAASDVSGGEQQVAEQRGIFSRGEAQAWDRLARDDENVARGLG